MPPKIGNGAGARVALLLLCPSLLACVTRDDDTLLLRREVPRAAGAPTMFRFPAPDDPTAARVRRLLADGFGAELLRTYAMTRRFAARAAGESALRATEPAYIALGPSDVHREVDAPGFRHQPYRDRVVEAGWFKSTVAPGVPFVWVDDDPATGGDRDAALMTQLVGGLGGAIVDLVAPSETRRDRGEWSYPLRDGYATFLDVVASEWRAPGAIDQRGELRTSPSFAEVRGNAAATRRPPDKMVRDPLVIATVLYRMASSEATRRMAPDAVVLPFLATPPPRGIPAAMLLGAFRNFEAKLLAAWHRAASAGKQPLDIVDLVEAYGDAYPDERAEVTRIFLVTTYGATALSQPISPRAAPDAVASALASLTADVLFGRRGLRDGL